MIADFYSSITGEKISGAELLKIAEGVWNLKRCFNIREGASRKDDKLPNRLLEPVEGEPSAGKTVDAIEGMLDEVYDAFGWDKKTGKPKRENRKSWGWPQKFDRRFDPKSNCWQYIKQIAPR